MTENTEHDTDFGPERPAREPDEVRTWEEDGNQHTVEIWREPDGSSETITTIQPIPVDKPRETER